MPQIPEPNYQRDEQQLIKYYKQSFQKILGEMRGITNGIEQAQADSLLRQIAYILGQLDQDTQQWVQNNVTRAFREGQAGAIYAIGEATSLTEAASLASFSLLARHTVETLVNDTYSDLLIATQNTEKKIKQLVRSVVSDTMRVKALEQLGRRTTRNAIIEKLTQQGLSRKLTDEAWVGIIDKAGRRWNLSTYAEMVVRTKLQQAHVEGVRVEALERGVDLAVISSHGATDPCRNYEGLVISMNGETPGYKTYQELRQSGKIFHPNCKHHISSIQDINLLPNSLKKRHEEAMRKI